MSTTPDAAAIKLRTRYRRVDELRPHPLNANRHPPEQIERLAAAIATFGFTAPIGLDRDGHVIAGAGRLEAARRAGLREVPTVDLSHLTPEQERAFMIADNRLGRLSAFDDAALQRELEAIAAAGLATPALGFTDAELAELLRGATAAAAAIAPVASAAAPAPPPGEEALEPSETAPTITREGEVWALGDHRIACADSTKPGRVRELLGSKRADVVLTDPPYAIYGSSTGITSSIVDDTCVRPTFRVILKTAELCVKKFGHVYVFCDWRSWSAWWEAARDTRLTPKNMIVWDKGGSGLGANYAMTHELVFFAAHLPPQRTMLSRTETGQRPCHAPNLVRYNRVAGAERLHNAAKPVAMLEGFLEQSTDAGQLVVDLFLGSGSTLIAAELKGRTCYAFEIAPRWCDVAVRRWQRATGATARLVGGPSFAELERERSPAA